MDRRSENGLKLFPTAVIQLNIASLLSQFLNRHLDAQRHGRAENLPDTSDQPASVVIQPEYLAGFWFDRLA